MSGSEEIDGSVPPYSFSLGEELTVLGEDDRESRDWRLPAGCAIAMPTQSEETSPIAIKAAIRFFDTIFLRD